MTNVHSVSVSLCFTAAHTYVHSLYNASFLPCLQICGPEQCSRYTNCTNCLYRIVDGVFQETGEESCQSICDAVNATVMADTISGPSDPRLDGTYTCITAPVDWRCSGITFYVKPNTNGSADILVSNSSACEC